VIPLGLIYYFEMLNIIMVIKRMAFCDALVEVLALKILQQAHGNIRYLM
jgi:hypothetical protein